MFVQKLKGIAQTLGIPYCIRRCAGYWGAALIIVSSTVSIDRYAPAPSSRGGLTPYYLVGTTFESRAPFPKEKYPSAVRQPQSTGR